jgi:hypothetical protein
LQRIGDFAPAAIIAHEIGHHTQFLLCGRCVCAAPGVCAATGSADSPSVRRALRCRTNRADPPSERPARRTYRQPTARPPRIAGRPKHSSSVVQRASQRDHVRCSSRWSLRTTGDVFRAYRGPAGRLHSLGSSRTSSI